MNLFLLALLPFAAQARKKVFNQTCYTGSITGSDGNSYTKDQVLAFITQTVYVSFDNVAEDDPEFNAFLKTRGTCQVRPCLVDVVKATMDTLYGKMGPLLFDQSSKAGDKMAIEALTGAVRACYPSPPRSKIKKVATKIVKALGQPAQEGGEFPQGVPCVNAERENEYPLQEVLQAFDAAWAQEAPKDKFIMDFFKRKAKDCQFPCLHTTIPTTALTLFLTGVTSDLVAGDAITGAFHACFPGVKSSRIQKLVKATIKKMNTAEETARLRLYISSWFIKDGSFNFFPVLSMVTAVALMLFFAGLALGRVWKRPAHRLLVVEEEDDQSLTEARNLQLHPE